MAPNVMARDAVPRQRHGVSGALGEEADQLAKP